MNDSKNGLIYQAVETGQSGAWIDSIIAAYSEQAQVGLRWLLQGLARERLIALNETLERQLERRTRQVQALVSALSQAEQQERKRIAQLLHDDLQQLLYGQLLRLEGLKLRLSSQATSGAVERIEQMTQLMEEAIGVTRTLVVELNPPGLENEELTEALRWLIRHSKEAYDLNVQLRSQDTCRIADPATRSLLVQIVRELLFNVVKHAETDRAAIELGQEDGIVIISVADNGRGFALEAVRSGQKKQNGFGLFSIGERLNLIGGRLEIESNPGQGTWITLIAPVAQEGSR